MNNFQKALGILEKAKQGSLFEKPREVIGTYMGKPVHFDSHKTRGLSAEDHQRHQDVHEEHYVHHANKGAEGLGSIRTVRRHRTLARYHGKLSTYHFYADKAVRRGMQPGMYLGEMQRYLKAIQLQEAGATKARQNVVSKLSKVKYETRNRIVKVPVIGS